MNSIISDYYDTFEMYQALRNQLMAVLIDEDLAIDPGGSNLSLGALCLEIGEIQVSYIQSFKTLEQDFEYFNPEEGLANNVQRLREWFEDLDRQLKNVVANFSDEDLKLTQIDRGHNFIVSPAMQLEIYKEALLIFYGKASVYLKMVGKPLPEQWQAWIA